MATPSILSSHTKSTSPEMYRSMRLPHARSSSNEKALSSDIIGLRCRTGANVDVSGAAPTRCVGESGVTSSGWASSMARNSRTRASYSASEISGSSSWW